MSIIAVSPAAPWLIKAAADVILVLHIGGGLTGLASGAVALAAPKGGALHCISGRVFFGSMLTMAAIGAVVSPFLSSFLNESPNVIAGVLTLYLITTSWIAVHRKPGPVGRFEQVGMVVALAVALAGGGFVWAAMRSPGGVLGDTPPQAFYIFLGVGAIAFLSDLKVIVAGGLRGAPRLARHLWRMCAALAIGAGSFFLGQEQVFPHWLQGSPILFAPVFAPLVLMGFWLIRVRMKVRTSGRDRPWAGLAKRPLGAVSDASPS